MFIFNRLFIVTMSAITIISGAAYTTSLLNTKAEASEDHLANLPEEKRKIMEDDERRLKDPTGIKKSEMQKGPSIQQKDIPVKTEILEHVEDPFVKEIAFENGWITEVKNNEMSAHIVGVGAGSLKEDPEQGIVFVRTMNGKREFISAERYKTPGKHGALKIIGYQGMKLELIAKDGTQWTFLVPKGEFFQTE